MSFSEDIDIDFLMVCVCGTFHYIMNTTENNHYYILWNDRLVFIPHLQVH